MSGKFCLPALAALTVVAIAPAPVLAYDNVHYGHHYRAPSKNAYGPPGHRHSYGYGYRHGYGAVNHPQGGARAPGPLIEDCIRVTFPQCDGGG
jgi:hypothetical protein